MPVPVGRLPRIPAWGSSGFGADTRHFPIADGLDSRCGGAVSVVETAGNTDALRKPAEPSFDPSFHGLFPVPFCPGFPGWLSAVQPPPRVPAELAKADSLALQIPPSGLHSVSFQDFSPPSIETGWLVGRWKGILPEDHSFLPKTQESATVWGTIGICRSIDSNTARATASERLPSTPSINGSS